MKKLAFAPVLVAALGLLAAPQTAHADRRAAAAVGGFIGGVIVGSVLANKHHGPPPPEVVYAPPPPEYCPPPPPPPPPTGYWTWSTTRVWVPGRWVVTYDHCGRHYRHWQPGYYEIRRERVWVETAGHHYGPPRHGSRRG
jgi:hypothetical protein